MTLRNDQLNTSIDQSALYGGMIVHGTCVSGDVGVRATILRYAVRDPDLLALAAAREFK